MTRLRCQYDQRPEDILNLHEEYFKIASGLYRTRLKQLRILLNQTNVNAGDINSYNAVTKIIFK